MHSFATSTRQTTAQKAGPSPLNFPAETGEGDRNLLENRFPRCCRQSPDFCSVTYGAGGSTRDKTLMIVDRIQREHGLTALAHLTCVNHTRDEVRAVLEKIRALGCKTFWPCAVIRRTVVNSSLRPRF